MRCGYCYETGHSRQHCARMKEHAKANPNSRAAIQLNKYVESIKNRSCTYCRERGHNKKFCKLIAEDKVVVEQLRSRWITTATSFLNKEVPIGTLYWRKPNSVSSAKYLVYCSRYESLANTRIAFMDYGMLREFIPVSTEESNSVKRYFESDSKLKNKERAKSIPGFYLMTLHSGEEIAWKDHAREQYQTIFDFNNEIKMGRLIPVDSPQDS